MISAIGAVKKGDSESSTQTGTMIVNSRTGLLVSSDMDVNTIITVQGRENKTKGKNRIRGMMK